MAKTTRSPHQVTESQLWSSPQVPKLRARCDSRGLRVCVWSAQLPMVSHLHNLGAGWVHWGKRGEEHVNFLFSCLKSLSLGVQEGIVALTFFSGRRVAACQRQLQADHLHFASSLRSERDALPFLLWRLGHRLTQIVLRPLIFSLPLPLPDFTLTV